VLAASLRALRPNQILGVIMPIRLRLGARIYPLTILMVVVALALAWWLDRMLGHRTWFAPCFAAVAISAGFGGIGPGILATLLAGLSVDFFLLKPLFSFTVADQAQAFDLGMFLTVGAISSIASQILHVAHRREEQLREAAESAQWSLKFLADASMALDSSIDYETTLKTVAKMAVPRLADWCAIELAEDGGVRTVAVAHVEPHKEDLVWKLQGRYPLNAQGQNPVQKVLHTGETDIFREIPDSALVSAARDGDHLGALRALRFRSFVCIPLKARGRTLGAVLFAGSAGDPYAMTDRTLAEDLGRRAALAVDNARLFRDAAREIEHRKQTEVALEERQDEVESLNERLQRAMVETHHRIKNNLQVIAAMIDMRVMEGDRLVPSSELQRLGSYVYTMAAVHDILTHETKESAADTRVNAKVILDKLLPLMQNTTCGRKLLYTTEDATVTHKQGTSIALLVNEMISNAVKHGHGDIVVNLRARDGQAILEVLDDGTGFPPGFDPEQASNTGLDLILSLSRWDLAGSVEFTNRAEGGARLAVTFPVTSEP
jgi:two-component sensor histidine kinase